MKKSLKIVLTAVVCTGLAFVAFQAGAFVQPEADGVAEKAFRAPGFEIRLELQRADRLPDQARGPALQDLDALGIPADRGVVDPRSGRWGTLILSQPVIPGDGKGNGLRWQDVGAAPPASENAFGAAAWNAFSNFVQGRRAALRVDPAEFGAARKVTVKKDGDLVQIYAPREVDGVPVRDSYVTATLSHGNMVLFGASRWGDVNVSTLPSVAQDAAWDRVSAFLDPYVVDGSWGRTELLIQPLDDGNPGNPGYDHRLVWAVRPTVEGSFGSWEGLVDAHSGELISFEDTNHYAATTREVVGGVLPVSNDGVAPDGVEQPGWPMPYADLTLAGGGGGATCGNGICEAGDGEDCVNCAADCNGKQNGNPNNRFCCGAGGGTNPVPCTDSRCTSSGFQCTDVPSSGGGGGDTFFTDGGGNLLTCVDGEMTTTLSGKYMRMSDDCGAISESTTGGVLDLGVSPGGDCNVATGASAGNTRSSRSGFYEMNRIIEQARGYLPGNGWLDEQLTSNMNINSTCNAFWSGSTVNFYRSGGGCANTGEIAGVFDHEWGHGMDDNDANPNISRPGEGIADIYAALRLNTSCIGRNFRLGTNCGGYGDPCTQCDGVRDIDWANRASGQPHDVAWIDANCGSGSGQPCGGSTHCEGAVYAEAVWDLFTRDLPAAGYEFNRAMEISTRITYLGAGNVGAWFTCVTNGEAGCNADGGYLNYLAADDDNGNINDGTPHMQEIFNAFDRHGIACSTPAVVNSGCAGVPTTAPSVTATGIDRAVQLSWTAVTGATKYRVYRTDGVFGCNFGKMLVGETTGTSFTDDGLLNGHDYYYTVIPVGGSDTCMGPSSACTTGTAVAGANAAVNVNSAVLSTDGGDGDAFLDNCEVGTLSFDVGNVGTGSLTNVRLTDVRPISHPTLTIRTTFPANTSPSSLNACDIGAGSFEFQAENGELAFDDTVVFEVDVTSDELAALGITKTATLTVPFAESDFTNFASKTYTYEADIEGWNVVQGIFQRDNVNGGANGTTWYVESSEFQADQCDQLQSPVIRMSSSTTLSASTRFDIEGVCTFPNCFPDQWFDRANIGVVDTAGSRSPVDPDGGRLYNAGGVNGTCGTDGQNGWAGTADSWAQSSWSSSALGASSFAGDLVRLDVRYGTDALEQGYGFRLDEVTLTDFEEQGPDVQGDTNCPVPPECGDGLCNGNETQCSCAQDCGTPPASEFGFCTDGVDNDCDLFIDCADSDCDGDAACSGPVCGNGVCESGEDCDSCSADCDSVTKGNPNGRYCCGNGILEGPEGDGRCDGNV